MPISSTMPISALRPGLAKNAWTICLLSTTVTSAQSTRNTSIRTRKIRGEDSLASSISIVEREEGAGAGIAASSIGRTLSVTTMAQRCPEKSRLQAAARREWELRRETRLWLVALLTKLCSLSLLTGICGVGWYPQALAAIAAFYSVDASRRNLFSSSPIRALRPPVGMRLAASIKPASSVFRSVPLSEPSSRQPFNRLSLKEAVMSSAVRPCNVSNVE